MDAIDKILYEKISYEVAHIDIIRYEKAFFDLLQYDLVQEEIEAGEFAFITINPDSGERDGRL